MVVGLTCLGYGKECETMSNANVSFYRFIVGMAYCYVVAVLSPMHKTWVAMSLTHHSEIGG
jgi:hypothetical protein